MLTLRSEAGWLYTGMMKDKTWLILSVITFIIAGVALFCRISALPQPRQTENRHDRHCASILLASYAYGRAHLPYMIYPDITVMSGFTEPATFRALFMTYIVAFIILFPGFYFFWKLFMKDRRYIRQEE